MKSMLNVIGRGKKSSRSNKVDLSAFSDFPVIDYSPEIASTALNEFIFSFNESGHRYDFILSKKNSSRLFVIFSGSANAKKLKLNPPVFQRWKWAALFPGSTLYVSDPSLYINNNLSLAWYIGTKEVDHLDVISRVVNEVAGSLGVNNHNIIGYGSSGGGFASLRMSAFIEGMTSVAINPQIVIKNYHKKAVNKYLKLCFGESFESFDFNKNSSRFDIRSAGINKKRNKLVVAQNTEDTFHLDNHYSLICDEWGGASTMEVNSENFKTILFSHPGGHSKAETKTVFKRIMENV